MSNEFAGSVGAAWARAARRSASLCLAMVPAFADKRPLRVWDRSAARGAKRWGKLNRRQPTGVYSSCRAKSSSSAVAESMTKIARQFGHLQPTSCRSSSSCSAVAAIWSPSTGVRWAAQSNGENTHRPVRIVVLVVLTPATPEKVKQRCLVQGNQARTSDVWVRHDVTVWVRLELVSSRVATIRYLRGIYPVSERDRAKPISSWASHYEM